MVKTAREAKRYSLDNCKISEEIQQGITRACNNGEFSCEISGGISSAEETCLQSLGYKIQYHSNSRRYTISWDEV